MEAPGYKRSEPDPAYPGLMVATKRRRAPWRWRRPLRCFLADLTRGKVFHHVTSYDRLRAAGEKWATFVYFCERCNRLPGHAHAAPAEHPVSVRVTRNK